MCRRNLVHSNHVNNCLLFNINNQTRTKIEGWPHYYGRFFVQTSWMKFRCLTLFYFEAFYFVQFTIAMYLQGFFDINVVSIVYRSNMFIRKCSYFFFLFWQDSIVLMSIKMFTPSPRRRYICYHQLMDMKFKS